MEKFIIKTNNFLNKDIQAFYHSDYHGGGNWRKDGTIENIITTLKNDITPYSEEILNIARKRLAKILITDIPQISRILKIKSLTVCVVPRAKKEDYYSENQKLFRKVVSFVVDKLYGFENGTNYILRLTNTRTTHRNKSGHGGDGDMPYPGITKQTCYISPNVRSKDILLIDDLYTKSINIDEDAIQALLDKGARSVYFYSVGKTIDRRQNFQTFDLKDLKYTENAINILVTKTFKGIGRAWILKNLKGNESIEEIIQLLNKKSKQSDEITFDDFENRREQIIEQLNKFGESCDGLIAIGDKNFPKYRGDVKQSEQPIYLFYKGDINLLNTENNNISVIGLLNPDKEIEIRERKIVKELVNQNITIVSGLALGCDSIAHQEALNGGKTIAILPSPLNNILPASNKGLAFKIVEQGGLLVTEYFEDFKSKMELSSRYKERDRLQALFCDTIVLAASYSQNSASIWKIYDKKLDSGARLAMEYAKNYNIPRAVMYNDKTDINNPMFDLNRQLVKEDNTVIILTKKNIEKIIDDIKKRKTVNDNFQLNLFS